MGPRSSRKSPAVPVRKDISAKTRQQGTAFRYPTCRPVRDCERAPRPLDTRIAGSTQPSNIQARGARGVRREASPIVTAQLTKLTPPERSSSWVTPRTQTGPRRRRRASARRRRNAAPAPAGIWKKWPSVDSNVADNDKQGRPSTAQPRVLFSRSTDRSSQQKNDWRSCGSSDRSNNRNKYLSVSAKNTNPCDHPASNPRRRRPRSRRPP